MGSFYYCDWCYPDETKEALEVCLDYYVTINGKEEKEEVDLCDECYKEYQKEMKERKQASGGT